MKLLLLLFQLALCLDTNYEQQWLLECDPKHAGLLSRLAEEGDLVEHLDLWTEHPSNSLMVRVDKTGFDNLANLECRKMRLTGHAAIRKALLQRPTGSSECLDFCPPPVFYSSYRSYDEILGRMDRIEGVRTEVIGKSHEGRDIKIARKGNPLGAKIWICAGQHAREWISPMTAMYLIEHLTDEKILEGFDVVVLSIANPDGYVFSQVVDRMWRKNRRPIVYLGRTVYGVDLNRNWDNWWGGAGTSRDPRSQVYAGEGPASEPEVKAIQDFVLGLEKRVFGIDLHSFGQFILRVYGKECLC